MRVDLPSLVCILVGLLWTFAILCSGPSSSATATTATATPVDRIVVVVRHGDRSPLQPFPWDGKVWQQQGYGHLTNVRNSCRKIINKTPKLKLLFAF